MNTPSDRMRVLLSILCAGAMAGCSSSSSGPAGETAGPGDASQAPGLDGASQPPGPDGASQPAGPDAAASLPDGTSPVVSIADGQLQGHVERSVYAFLGIPYAAPPVSALRWKEPQPAAPWTGVRDASQFGNRCPQNASSTNQTPASSTEDCLYLNVWTPNPAASKLPVMVWIHGGGNFGGSASDPLPPVVGGPNAADGGYFYDGASLSGNGTVVVSLNYRLGVFGFFPHPGLVAEGSKAGNQALWDQRFAMQWVQANIAKFGGDPQNVTIFGESAGAYNVCLHVASAPKPALFVRAISESGGCTTRQPTLAEAQPLALGVAAEVGCAGTATGNDGGASADGAVDAAASTGDASAADSLACLRGLTTEALLATHEEDTSSGLAEIFSAVVDGDFLTDQPRTLFQNGSTAKAPYLLGSNNDEAMLFELSATAVTDQAGLTAAIAQNYGDAGATLSALYPLSEFDGGYPNPFQAALTRMMSDQLLICNTYDSAQLSAAQGVPAYSYNFDISLGVSLGACHGSELPYVFGTGTQLTTGSRQAAASALMERYWTRFASKGDPSGGSDPAWPSFSASSNQRMQFTLQGPSIVSNFHATECAYWISTYESAFTDPGFRPSL
jgi:para-nitrobenzyl esterase